MKSEEQKVFKSTDACFNCMEERQRNEPLIQKIWEYFYFPAYRFFTHQIGEIPRKIKWFLQRGSRGFSDCDAWGGGDYLLKVMGGLTGNLKNKHVGYPHGLSNEKWTRILDEMENGFKSGRKIWEGMEEVLDDDGKFKSYRNYTKEEMDKFLIEYSHSMSLLNKYLFSLWD